MKHVVIVALLALFGATAAAGQAIPIDIPDTPGESPADREREKREERHHAALSRFYGTTSVAASPFVTGGARYLDTIFEGGVETRNGDALFLMLGARSSEATARTATGSWVDQIDGGGQLFALGYELALTRFSSNSLVGRTHVAISAGGFLGDVDMMYVEVSPRYIVRVNPYWSFPIGLKFSTGFLSDNADPTFAAGVTAGVRRHFGQREVLE